MQFTQPKNATETPNWIARGVRIGDDKLKYRDHVAGWVFVVSRHCRALRATD